MEMYLVSATPKAFSQVFEPFIEKGITLTLQPGLDEAVRALKACGDSKPSLIVLDESEGRSESGTMRRACMQLLALSPFSYCTAISSLPETDFHDAMEGLGMLSPLPLHPGRRDVLRLIGDLAKFVSLP